MWPPTQKKLVENQDKHRRTKITEKLLLPEGRYTFEIKATNASTTYGPSIGLCLNVVKGAHEGEDTWVNLQSSQHPVSKRIFIQNIERLGVSKTSIAEILRAFKDREQKGYEEIGQRLRGVVFVGDITTVESKRNPGKQFMSLQVVERVETEVAETASSTDILDVLN